MEANRDVVRETQQQRVKHLEQAKVRFNNGVATEIDVLRSEVNVANLEPELIRAENRVRLARATINNLIVADLDAPTKIAGSLEYRPWAAGSLEEIQRRTLELARNCRQRGGRCSRRNSPLRWQMLKTN